MPKSRYFFRRTAKGRYHTGEVFGEAKPGDMFLRFIMDEDNGSPSTDPVMVLTKIEDIMAPSIANSELGSLFGWKFFDSREELDDFLRRLDDLLSRDEPDENAPPDKSSPQVN
jgi:hypothetical protein